MSRNFELMQQAEKDQDLFRSGAPPDVLSRNVIQHQRVTTARLATIAHEEAIKLVQRLFLLPEAPPRAVLFTGVESGDGSSSICVCAVETLASLSNGTICVVDANLRTPALHRYFQVENRIGWAQALCQSGPIQSFAQPIYGNRVCVITAGAEGPEAAELLNSSFLPGRMAELKASFNHVLLDGPPVNSYADSLTVGKLCDGAILVVSSESTRREAAKRSKDTLGTADVRVLGAVLNRRTFPIPQALYDRL